MRDSWIGLDGLRPAMAWLGLVLWVACDDPTAEAPDGGRRSEPADAATGDDEPQDAAARRDATMRDGMTPSPEAAPPETTEPETDPSQAPALPELEWILAPAGSNPLGSLQSVRVQPTAEGNELTAWLGPACEDGAARCGEAVEPRLLTVEESQRILDRIEAVPEGRCVTASPVITAAPQWSLRVGEISYVSSGALIETCDGYKAAQARLASLLGRLALPTEAPVTPERCSDEPLAQDCPCDWPQGVCTDTGAALMCGGLAESPHLVWVEVIDGPCWPFGCEDEDALPDLETCLALKDHCYARRDGSGTYCSRSR